MYRLTQAAEADIEAILTQSFSQFGALQTERYFHSLRACLELLAENPSMGTSAEKIRAGYRRFYHQSHVIFYLEEPAGILIVRLLHFRMNAIEHLLNDANQPE